MGATSHPQIQHPGAPCQSPALTSWLRWRKPGAASSAGAARAASISLRRCAAFLASMRWYSACSRPATSKRTCNAWGERGTAGEEQQHAHKLNPLLMPSKCGVCPWSHQAQQGPNNHARDNQGPQPPQHWRTAAQAAGLTC